MESIFGEQTLQSKKKALLALETALNKRVSELRDLCLKEGVSRNVQHQISRIIPLHAC